MIKTKPLVTQPPARVFESQIQAAIADGVKPAAMVLRLTLKDGHRLRRDASVALDAINYAEGEMRFLGVKVTEGGVDASVLDRDGAKAKA
jgi:hypothetical protein